MKSSQLEFLYPYKGVNCSHVYISYNEHRMTVDLYNDYQELMFRGFEKDMNEFIHRLKNKYFV